MRGNFGLFCSFSPKLPQTHIGLHCNANEKTNREKGLFFFEPSCNLHFSQQCWKPRRRQYDRCNRCHVLGHIANVSWNILDLLECVFIQIVFISSSGVYKLAERSNPKDMVNVSKNRIIARTGSIKKLLSRTYPSFWTVKFKYAMVSTSILSCYKVTGTNVNTWVETGGTVRVKYIQSSQDGKGAMQWPVRTSIDWIAILGHDVWQY